MMQTNRSDMTPIIFGMTHLKMIENEEIKRKGNNFILRLCHLLNAYNLSFAGWNPILSEKVFSTHLEQEEYDEGRDSRTAAANMEDKQRILNHQSRIRYTNIPIRYDYSAHKNNF